MPSLGPFEIKTLQNMIMLQIFEWSHTLPYVHILTNFLIVFVVCVVLYALFRLIIVLFCVIGVVSYCSATATG
jgi:hypothetical protein